jgi:NAD(P)-dependent dehydrogenase (short-subunit alcohol dehydrogenase family)/acyl carrier protein
MPSTNGHAPAPARIAIAPAPAPAPAPATADHLLALQQLAEQTARLHRQFLEGQETAQRTFQMLLGLQAAPAVAPIAIPTAPAPALVPVVVEPPRVQTPAAVPSPPPAPKPEPPNVEPRRPEPPPAPASAPSVVSSAVADALLEVVAEKTGYPADMLELGMSLDADLGIDSIKRVEILSALQDRLPDAPAIGPDQLGSIHTLGDIVAFLGGVPAIAVDVPAPTPKVEIPAPAKASSVRLERLTPRPRAMRSADRRERIAFAPGAEIAVVEEGSGLSAAVRAELDRRGFKSRAIGLDDEKALAAGSFAGLILAAPQSLAPDFLKRAFRLVRAAGPSLRRSGGSALLTVSRLDGSFGLDGLDDGADPVAGGLAGLAKTAGHEWHEVSCKALDLARDVPDDDAARRIVDELTASGPAEVGISSRGAFEIGLERTDWTSGNHRRSPVLDRGDLVVVTGGARGIAAEAAVELAKAYRATLLLLGRTPVADAPEPAALVAAKDETALRATILREGLETTPKKADERAKGILARREIAATLARVREAGAEAVYEAVDVRDRDAVRAAVGRAADRFGPVRGLVHAAGVLADRRIEDQTDAQFASVYETKVDGLLAVFDALEPAALRAIAAYSSSTGRFGRVGQASYAVANEALNKWCQAQARRLPDCRVVSFNWGPWEGGMVTPSLRAVFEREGMGLIPMAEGAALVAREIQESRENPVEIVVLADPPASLVSTPEATAVEPADADMRPAFERPVDIDAFPVLRSHVIDGHAVLPMALILEWLGEAALHRHPGFVVAAVEDLRLLKGVVLRDHRPVPVSLRAGKGERRDGSLVVPVEMRGAAGEGREVVHARASVVLADRHPAGARTIADAPLPPLAEGTDSLYDGVLFHGPDMQAIERVEGCDDRGIAARVSTSPPPSEWAARPLRREWLTDPLAIDAAFQVMVLWCRQRSGTNSLPTAVGAYRQFRRRFPAEGVRVVIEVRQAGDHRAVADVEFVDDRGDLVARIDGYECVADASLNQAFQRNRLARTREVAKPR